MKIGRRVVVLVAALLAVLLPASTAQAASGGYGINPTGGVIRQTNWWYPSNSVTWSSAPSNAVITTVYWSYSLTNYSNVVAQLCISAGCLNLPTGIAFGNTTAFAGYSANQTWYFRFAVATPTTYVLNPPRYGNQHNVTVNYNF